MKPSYLQTIQLTAQGLPQKTIAVKLQVSRDTVHDRVDRIKKQYGAVSIPNLIYILCKLGVL